MTALAGAVIALLAMFGVAAFLLWLRDRIGRPGPRELARRAEEYERALRSPDWETVRAEFHGEIPAAVERLYRDTALLARRDVPVGDSLEIGSFVPANDSAFDPEQWFDPPSDSFVFAVTRFGDPFFVRTAEIHRGLPVSVVFHETGEIEQIAETLEQFLEDVSRSAAVADRGPV